jgi:hypothetical protein
MCSSWAIIQVVLVVIVQVDTVGIIGQGERIPVFWRWRASFINGASPEFNRGPWIILIVNHAFPAGSTWWNRDINEFNVESCRLGGQGLAWRHGHGVRSLCNFPIVYPGFDGVAIIMS